MDDFVTVNYTILFEPDLEKFVFRGEEKIAVKITKPAKKIVLNAADLKVAHCSIVQKGASIPLKFRLDMKKEEMTIYFPRVMKGDVELHIGFEGVLSDSLSGFYRSAYETADKKKRYLATTQFEAADARRAFPCLDRPNAKATFDISMIVKKGLTAISNMPITEEKDVWGGKKLVRFVRTPRMSTYLLYLCAGELEHLEGRMGDITLRVYSTPGKKEQGRMALDFCAKFVDFYQKYFGIPYPLPKLDLIAIPDFAAGAMENWGAITFRETALLFDPKNSSTMAKQTIAEVIAHELVHHWFGDLVTMEWWDDIWLNESFATFMAYESVDHYFPEWDMWSQFMDLETSGALELDSLKSSHPVSVEIKHPSQIREVFDEISYNKGGSILRMMKSYLGEEKFREGLKNYLKGHEYGNATTQDLWDALEKASRSPVGRMMDSWIKQQGYPVVEAEFSDKRLTLSQKRFLFTKPKSDKTRWLIPVSVRLDDKETVSAMLKEKSMTMKLSDTPDCFKVNLGQTGFYRVKYPKSVLKVLEGVVAAKKLGNIDRWGLQNDLFAMVVAGEASVSEYLDLVEAYSDEDDYLVLADIADNLSFIYLLSHGEKFWPKIIEFNMRFFRRIFARLGWKPGANEKHTDTILRSQSISALGKLGDETVARTAREKFQTFLANPDSLHPDLRGAVFSLVAWNGDDKTYGQLVKLYRKSSSPEEKRRLLSALAGFRDEKLIGRAMEFSLSADVRSQDLFIPAARGAANIYGRKLVWPWVKKNWANLRKRYVGGSVSVLARIIDSLGVLSDKEVAKDVQVFFRKRDKSGIKMPLAQAVENIGINARFSERMRKEFIQDQQGQI